MTSFTSYPAHLTLPSRECTSSSRARPPRTLGSSARPSHWRHGLFFYREANIALAKATQKKRNACIKQRRSPSEAVRARAFALGLDSLDDLGPQEVCALHLSALVRTAFTEHETSGTGLLVSYDEDLSSNGGRFVPETVLPYLGVGSAANPGTEARGRVDAVLAIDAKARDSGRVWDAAAIKADVGIDLSEEIREASRTFLQTNMFEISRARAL